MRELQLSDLDPQKLKKVVQELHDTTTVGSVTTSKDGKVSKSPIRMSQLKRAMAGVKKARKKKWH